MKTFKWIDGDGNVIVTPIDHPDNKLKGFTDEELKTELIRRFKQSQVELIPKEITTE